MTRTTISRAATTAETADDPIVEVDLPETATSNRDLLLQRLDAERTALTKELSILEPQLQAAIELLEKLDEPRKNRERLGQELTRVKALASATMQSLRNEIERAAPAELRAAIRTLKSQLESRTGAAWSNCETALAQLDALTWQAGDLRPAIRKVFEQLAKADFAAISDQ